MQMMMNSLAKHYKFSLTKPFVELPKKIQNIILHGAGPEKFAFEWNSRHSSGTFQSRKCMQNT
jgi:excinuclease UvrABC ATPase subunit